MKRSLMILALAGLTSAGYAQTTQPATVKPLSDEAKLEAMIVAPKVFRRAMNQVLPSLVTIETYGGVLTKPKSGGRRGPASVKPGEGPTTGVIVSSEGHIITSSFNFTKEPPIITVVLQDGRRRVAKIISRDEIRKLCMLKIDDVKDLPVPEFVGREGMKVGQYAISVGVGYGGAEPAMSVGIISAKSRVSGKAIQTDANISPANYGGPLINVKGQIVGLCVPLTPRGNDDLAGSEWYDSGIGFAVPLHPKSTIVASMKEGKSIKRGIIGFRPARRPMPEGVGVFQVAKGSPADKAGMKKGDVLIGIDGKPTPNNMILGVVLGQYKAGDKISVEILRGDEKLKLDVVLSDKQFKFDRPKPTVKKKVTKPTTQPATKPSN